MTMTWQEESQQRRAERTARIAARRARPATERQKDFLRRLALRKAYFGQDIDPAQTLDMFEHAFVTGMTNGEASDYIDAQYRTLPHRKPGDPVRITDIPGYDGIDVPEGHYAIETNDGTRFYRVGEIRKGPHEGQMGIQRIAGDREILLYPSDARTALDLIVADPSVAAWLFADLIGKCHHCNRTLTDPVSRMVSVGPDCRGWGPTKALRTLANDQTRKAVYRDLSVEFSWSARDGKGVAAAAAWTALPTFQNLDSADITALLRRAYTGDIDPVVRDGLLNSAPDSVRLMLHSGALSLDLLTVLNEHSSLTVRTDVADRLMAITLA
jgi:hypothetical protein